VLTDQVQHPSYLTSATTITNLLAVCQCLACRFAAMCDASLMVDVAQCPSAGTYQ
jgi:hypothetical protein